MVLGIENGFGRMVLGGYGWFRVVADGFGWFQLVCYFRSYV